MWSKRQTPQTLETNETLARGHIASAEQRAWQDLAAAAAAAQRPAHVAVAIPVAAPPDGTPAASPDARWRSPERQQAPARQRHFPVARLEGYQGGELVNENLMLHHWDVGNGRSRVFHTHKNGSQSAHASAVDMEDGTRVESFTILSPRSQKRAGQSQVFHDQLRNKPRK